MREAEERAAWLKEDDEETFAWFGQFVYMYDYTHVKPSRKPNQDEGQAFVDGDGNWATPGMGHDDRPPSRVAGRSEADGGNDGEAVGGEDWVGDDEIRNDNEYRYWDLKPRRRGPTPKNSRYGSWLAFTHENYRFENPYASAAGYRKFSGSYTYRHVFLCHARVYVFADKYAIDSLKTLALKKLHRMLCVFNIYPRSVRDIADVLRYSFNHTRDSRDEPLRALLAQYVACKAEELDRWGDLGSLLLTDDTPRELPCEIVRAMVNRLRGIRCNHK